MYAELQNYYVSTPVTHMYTHNTMPNNEHYISTEDALIYMHTHTLYLYNYVVYDQQF